MLRWGRLSAVSQLAAVALSMLAAGSALAQVPAPAPTVRDLATRFVKDPTNGTALAEAREQMLATVLEKGKDLPPSMKSWLATAAPAAAEQVVKDMMPIIEEKLIDAYSEKFTVEELQQILELQAFVRQPNIAKAFLEASSAPTALAKMEIMKSKLTAAEFERVSVEMMKHPMLTMTMLTLKLTEEITGEFVKRFGIALRQHCATAPHDFSLCEDQGRAL